MDVASRPEFHVAHELAGAFQQTPGIGDLRATNVAPFPFEWVDVEQTSKEYGALLIRVSREYDRRFA